MLKKTHQINCKSQQDVIIIILLILQWISSKDMSAIKNFKKFKAKKL